MKRKLTTLWHIILQWEQINDIFFELLHQNDDAEFCIIIWASFLCNILLLSDSKEEEEKYYSVQIFRKIRGLCLMKWPDSCKKIHVLDESFEKSLSIFFESDTKTRNKNANKMEVVYPFSIIIEGPSINDVRLGGICQKVPLLVTI